MRMVVALTALGTGAAAATGGLRFGAPRLIGSAYYVTGFQGLGGSVAFGPTEAGTVLTTDSGQTWRKITLDPKWIGPGLLAADGTSIHDMGAISRAASSDLEKPRTNFSAPNCTRAAMSAGGVFGSSTVAKEVTFSGLPAPGAFCATGKPLYGCPFRTGGRGYVRLADGTLVQSIIVYLGGKYANPQKNLAPYATSVVSFRSRDDGYTWAYAGMVLSAADAPHSQEGPNENDLVLLADGKTIMCIVRLDAGDGKLTHPYVPYYRSVSTDGGFTWKASSLGEGVGCARPRLLGLGDGAIILSGGRLGPTNRDVIMWVNAAGDGYTWDAHSVTYWHNQLITNKSWAFTAAVNTSSERQSTSYTSLVQTGPQSGFVTYGRHLPPGPDLAFAMPFSFAQ